MITTTEIAPSPILAPFIRCYCYREFDTGGSDLVKRWHATHELTMPFFFKELPVKLIGPEKKVVIEKGTWGGLSGMSTQYNGDMFFKGSYSFFEISFRPNGFYKIFKIPSDKCVNQIIGADDIFDVRIKLFYEQLCEAADLQEMAILANVFLSSYLKKQKSLEYKDAITSLSNIFLRRRGLVNIKRMAYDANMSLRNFERHFTEQVGVSPKLFGCIARFNHALSLKLKYPEENWTSIAFESGYFDQMHLIKDFKRFYGYAPSIFFKETPMREEKFNSRIEP
jgi:AraC-like DNA-binding protein